MLLYWRDLSFVLQAAWFHLSLSSHSSTCCHRTQTRWLTRSTPLHRQRRGTPVNTSCPLSSWPAGLRPVHRGRAWPASQWPTIGHSSRHNHSHNNIWACRCFYDDATRRRWIPQSQWIWTVISHKVDRPTRLPVYILACRTMLAALPSPQWCFWECSYNSNKCLV